MRSTMGSPGLVWWVAWLLLLLPAIPAAADASGQPGRTPREALRPLGAADELQLSPEDRCPVCAMYPAKWPKFAAAMTLHDHRTYYFCANSCLLRAWRQPDRYLGVPSDLLGRMVVLDFFSGAGLDAHAAWWVAGSDIVGPMGPALVALGNPSDLERFRARHGGATVFRLEHLDDALWGQLFPRRPRF